jgi:hypothetical protein
MAMPVNQLVGAAQISLNPVDVAGMHFPAAPNISSAILSQLTANAGGIAEANMPGLNNPEEKIAQLQQLQSEIPALKADVLTDFDAGTAASMIGGYIKLLQQ